MLIEYRGIDVCHKGKRVLDATQFTVDEGEFVYLTGKVGSGKTSLIKTLYGDLPVVATSSETLNGLTPKAEVLGYDMFKMRGSRVQELRRKMGIVFQGFHLLTDRTVRANLDFVLRATGWKKRAERESRIAEVLDMVGMSAYLNNKPYELSGGEQQCVCIARALLNSPALILADEATGNLDYETGRQAASLLYNISREQGTAVLMITHNEALISHFPGRLLRFEDGRLIEPATNQDNTQQGE